MNRKYIITIVLVALVSALVSVLVLHEKMSETYGKDIKLMQDSFPNITGMSKCCYRIKRESGDVGKKSEYHITAMIRAEEFFDSIGDTFSDDPTENPQFDENITYEMGYGGTGDWYENEDLTVSLLGDRFTGDLYYNKENSLIYLNVDSR